ncbi:HNH endonuclease [Pseudomonas protegens]|uniref:HNH endonuclease n=1 Tax=Pseudomonas protegens TaxID=380021 RepID=UPI0034D3CF9C
MFFNKLTRHPEKDYHSNRGTFYADYRDNYSKISLDCEHKCVYCDISSEEYGGDEMHLDHFRPQEHFKDLATHPYNLYLSCPKCNILKTSDWPAPKKPKGPTFIGSIGYIDRFEHDCATFLKVDNDGYIVPISGPVKYMIVKMHLNRPSRVNVRRRRIIEHRKTMILAGILRLTEKLNSSVAAGKLTIDQREQRRAQIDALLISYSKL